MNINDLNDQQLQVIEYIANDAGDIQSIVYAPILPHEVTLSDEQLQQIIDSHIQSTQPTTTTDISPLFTLGVALLIVQFAIFGALIIKPLIHSLYGRTR